MFDIFYVADPGLVLRVALAIFSIGILATFFSTTALAYIAFLVSFIIPTIYRWKKTQIDCLLGNIDACMARRTPEIRSEKQKID